MTLIVIASGKFARVCMTASLNKDFLALAKEGKGDAKRRLENHMKFYANDGPKYLSDAKFKKNEGRHALGPGFARDVLVQAFADVSEGIRIYGCHETIGSDSTFVCTVMDQNKKKRKADPAKLSRTATSVGTELRAMGVTK